MLLEMRELSELSLTNLTSVGFDAKVNPRVLGEVGAVCKSFTTSCTFIWFGFSQMNLCVELKVCFAVKSLKKNSCDMVKEAEID